MDKRRATDKRRDKQARNPMIVIDGDSEGFYLARIDVRGSVFDTPTGFIVGEGRDVQIALSTALTRLGYAALHYLNRKN